MLCSTTLMVDNKFSFFFSSYFIQIIMSGWPKGSSKNPALSCLYCTKSLAAHLYVTKISFMFKELILINLSGLHVQSHAS